MGYAHAMDLPGGAEQRTREIEQMVQDAGMKLADLPGGGATNSALWGPSTWGSTKSCEIGIAGSFCHG